MGTGYQGARPQWNTTLAGTSHQGALPQRKHGNQLLEVLRVLTDYFQTFEEKLLFQTLYFL